LDYDVKASAKEVAHPQKVLNVTWNLADEAFRVAERWVNFRDGTYERVDFRAQQFDPFNATASTFIDCDFRKAKFRRGVLGHVVAGARQSIYRRCTFDGAHLRKVAVANARFESCSFREAKLDGWRADEAEFVDCVFEGRLFDVRFAGRPWEEEVDPLGRAANEFRGNDFRNAELDRVMFVYGIDLDAQLLPTGRQYARVDDLRLRIERARREIAAWSDEGAREHATFMLQLFSDEGYAEQQSLFFTRDFRSVPRAVSERVWALLGA
jgi:hypothetical protein